MATSSQARSSSPDDSRSRDRRRVGDYTLGDTLGAGSFGKVKLATHVTTGEKVAIKIVSKETIADVDDIERVYRETFILKTLKHQNIIKIFEVIDTTKAIMLVMEYADGGELFDYIASRGRLPESEASHVFQQIVAGVDYCHRKKIIHRDLKLENVLMNTDKTIKIADFGLSNTIKFGQKMGTACGTPSYTAPEMIQNKEYAGASVDIWALGVILFAMVCGFLPFQAKSAPALYKKIVKGSVLLPEYLSKSCKDIIMNMLNVDPDKRFDLGRIRSHAWLSMDFDDESSIPISLAQIAAAAAANMAHTGDNTVARLLADRITPITVTPPAPAATAASSTMSSNTPSNSGSPSASTCSSPTEEPVEQVEIDAPDSLKPRISLDTDTGANSPIVFGVAARSGAPIQTSASRPRLAPSPQTAAAAPSTGFASARRHSAVLTRPIVKSTLPSPVASQAPMPPLSPNAAKTAKPAKSVVSAVRALNISDEAPSRGSVPAPAIALPASSPSNAAGAPTSHFASPITGRRASTGNVMMMGQWSDGAVNTKRR